MPASFGPRAGSSTRSGRAESLLPSVHQLIVVGLGANTCIDSTVRYAAELGYEVTLVKDAIGSYSSDEMKATLELNAPNYARAIWVDRARSPSAMKSRI